jgi:hypothetical protein
LSGFERESFTSSRQGIINDLERQIAQVEGGGDLDNSQIDRVAALRQMVEAEKQFIALKKVEWDSQDREAQIYELERDRAEILTKRANLLRDLDQLENTRRATKGAGAATNAIDAQIAATRAALDSVEALTTASASRIAQARVASEQVAASQTEEIAAATGEARAEIEAAASKKKIENDEKANRALKRQNEKLVRELRRLWDNFADALAKGITDAIEELSRGGSAGNAFRAMIDTMGAGLRDMMQENLSQMFKDIAVFAQTGKDASGADVTSVAGLSRRGAKGVAAGVMGATALAGILNNGASRGANITNGLITGASVGAQIGTLVGHPIIGAVIGAVVGGIAGAFAKTARKVGFQFTGSGGNVRIRALGDTKAYELAQAQRDFNKAVAVARSGMLDVFAELPTATLLAITSNLSPKLPDFDRKIEPVNQAGEAIADFLQTTVPQLVVESFFPAIEETAKLLGTTDAKAKQLIAELRPLDFTDAQQLVGKFFSQLATLGEIARFGAMSNASRIDFATAQANRTVPQQLSDAGARLGAMIPKNFESLSIQEQTTYIDKLLPAIQQAYAAALEYWAKIGQMSKDSLKAIDDQIFEYRLQDLDPQQQMNELLGRGRGIKDAIKNAATPEEVARLTQEYQQLIDRMVELAGGRPEDRAHAIAALDDLRNITENRYKELADEAAKAAKPLFDQIQRILNALQNGLAGIGFGTPAEGGGGVPGGTPDGDPRIPGTPWNRTADGATFVADGLQRLGNAANGLAGAWEGQFPVDGTPAGGSGDVTDSGANQGMVVQVSVPAPNVTFVGDIGGVLKQWRTETVNESVELSVRTMQRIRSRGRG